MAPLDIVPDGPRSTTPTQFLLKTYQLVDDHSVDDIISWTDTGDTFVVWRPGEFANDLLPQKFKHNNFTSFIRQLNTYGFRKVSQNRWEFTHQFFRRGHEDLLSRMDRRRRSAASTSAAAMATDKTESSSDEPMQSSDSKDGRMAALKEEIEQLKKENARLKSENTQMKRFCEGIQNLMTTCNISSMCHGETAVTAPAFTGEGSSEFEDDELSLQLSNKRMRNA